jgi:hypothetical protein
MTKRHYLKYLLSLLSLRSLFSGLRSHTTSVSGAVCKGSFSRFYGCKKCYNRKAKGLAIENRHHKKRYV